jgi:hypothetical protein
MESGMPYTDNVSGICTRKPKLESSNYWRRFCKYLSKWHEVDSG